MEYNLNPYLQIININLKHLKASNQNKIYYLDSHNILQKALSKKDILKLNLNNGITTITNNYSLSTIEKILGINKNTINWSNYSNFLSKEQLEIIKIYDNVTVPQYLNTFEALSSIIFGQQVAVAVAQLNRMAFVSSCGEKINDNLYLYPTIENISEVQINNLNITTMKKRALLELCDYLSSNNEQFNNSSTFNYSKVTQELQSIFGIGKWTIDWFLLQACNKLHIIPSGDLQVKKTFCKFFNNDEYMNIKKLNKLEQQLYPYGGLLSYYLLNYYHYFQKPVN